MPQKMIPILQIGNYTDATGQKIQITPQIFTDIVDSYQQKSAPLVKGHPTNDDPAMGWIDKLTILGDKLYASFVDISEEFKNEIKKNLFKNISASFFLPDSPSNPNKGKYCLRHVGALGATRPAIPNLGTLQDILAFSEDENKQISFFSSYSYSFKDRLILLQHSHKIQHESHYYQKQLEKAYKEITVLKEKLAKKELEEKILSQISQIQKSQLFSPEMISKITDRATLLANKGIEPQESVALFSEFLEQNQQIYTHRFHGQTPNIEQGTVNFSENSSIEETAVFADEVEKLYSSGMSRSDAYRQAKEILCRGKN